MHRFSLLQRGSYESRVLRHASPTQFKPAFVDLTSARPSIFCRDSYGFVLVERADFGLIEVCLGVVPAG